MTDTPVPPEPPQPPAPPPGPPPVPPPPAAPRPTGAGTVGKPRSIGISILLFIVTLGIYGWFWAYYVYEENKRYSGEGLGGVVGLIIEIFIRIVNWFIIPHEIQRNLYEREGQQSPVSPIWGLWFLLPIIGGFIWYVKVQSALNDFWMARGAPAP